MGDATVWGWRRWIKAAHREAWAARLDTVEGLTWISTERPGQSRILLASYSERRADAMALVKKFGGQARSLKPSAWLKPVRRPPLSIGGKFQIVDEPARAVGKSKLPRLRIPHGLAFGSGEHATTCLLLRALTRRVDWRGVSVLDLGTGSGVLALAARMLGARKIVATDFDAEAVRTAIANEALNFPTATVRWRCADVKKLRPTARYDLVLANIFSGILIEAAPQIAASVAPGGQLWLSGVLCSQRDEVLAAYRRQKLKLDRVVSRGKWVMLQLCSHL
jgi:ribosomal protein L11 methyltransferase